MTIYLEKLTNFSQLKKFSIILTLSVGDNVKVRITDDSVTFDFAVSISFAKRNIPGWSTNHLQICNWLDIILN